MKRFFAACACTVLVACTAVNAQTTGATKSKNKTKATSCCSSDCQAANKNKELTCKLTSPELHERKATVLASLRKQMVERKELPNGYAFKFAGSDKMIDELVEFVKTERQCCDFFTFNLSISGDGSEAWLELTGPEGSKDFVTQELEL